MQIITSWTEQHWKLVMLVMAGGLYGSYRLGEYRAEQAYIEERHQAEVKTVERERDLQKQISQAQTQATKTIEVVKWRTRTIREKVDEWAKTNPSDCRLDADGVRLWNAANAGAAAGTQ